MTTRGTPRRLPSCGIGSENRIHVLPSLRKEKYMRLFLAISLEGTMRQSLLTLQEQWKSLGVKGHFVPPENLHLTLAFIGEYGKPDAVMDALASVPFEPFPLRLDRLGHFGDLYWAGIADNTPLTTFVKRLRHAE